MKQFSSLRILLLVLLVGSGLKGFSQCTVFSENMGTPTATTTFANYNTGTAPATWQNKGTLTYGQGGQTNPGDVRISSVSSGYTGASGAGNVFLTTTSGAFGFSIESIDASYYTGLSLSYGYRKESATLHATFSVDYSIDNGSTWVTLANTSTALFNEAATATAGWYLAKTLSLPSTAQISGLKIRFVKTGTASIRIDDVKLLATGATAPTVSGGPFTGTYNTAFSGSVTATNGPITSYQVASGSLPPGVTLTAGTGALSGTPTAAGSYTANITATNCGGTGSATAVSFTINKANQTISFSALPDRPDTDPPFGLTATASSGLPVSYTSSNTGVITISGSTATIVAAGTSTITAIQAGNANYNAATSVQQTQNIISTTKQNQTITFLPISNQVYGVAPIDPGATASSNLPVTYSSSNTSVAVINGSNIEIVGVGTVTITANQAGDATYNAAPAVNQTFTVTQKALTFSGGVASDKTYDGTTATTVASGGLQGVVGTDDVYITSFAANFSDANAGTGKTVTGAFVLGGADAAKYTLTQPTFTANINKAAQTITFAALPNRTTADVSFIARATATSGGTVTFTSSDPSVATVTNDSVVTIIGVGTVLITAHQAGTTNYNAANDVSQGFTVTRAVAGWDFTGPGNTATFAATYYDANLNSSNLITRGAGAAASAGPNSFRTVGFQNNGISTSNTDYFQTTVSVANGYELSLSSIEESFAGTATFYQAPGVSSQWAYSLDGTNFTLIGSPTVSTAASLSASVDLSSISALQFIPSGATVIFRYYASGQTTTGGWGFFSAAAGTAGLAFTGNVTVAPLPNITLDEVNPNAGNLDQGSTDAIIGALKLNVGTANAILNSVTVNTAGTYVASDLTNIKFWLSSSPSTISGATQLGTTQTTVASGASAGVTGLNNIITSGSVRYILITTTIAGNAVPGHTLNITSTPFANIGFASGNKLGTNPIPAGNVQTITQLNPTVAISDASPAAGTINQSTTNQILRSIRLAISVTSATLTGVTMTTAGTYQVSDIATNGFKLWINTANNLTGATQLGTDQPVVPSSGNISVSGLSQLLNNNTTYYIIATADVAYNASPSRNISIAVTQFNNINFTTADKTGTDPVAAGNTQTFGAVVPNIAIATLAATSATVGAPAANTILYQFSAAVTTNTTAINSVTVTTSGTYTGADFVPNTFKLWYSTTNTFSTATQIGSNRPIVISGGTIAFTGLSQTISPATTGFFWITGDLASSAVSGHTIRITAPTLSSFVFNQGNKSGTPTAGGTITLFPAPALTDVLVPQYMEGTSTKMPFIYRVKLTNLKANATYRYYNTMDTVGYTSASGGAGTIIFASSSGYTQTSTGSFSTAGSYGQFTADASGTYAGWFINESTSNARFNVGKTVMGRIFLNDGAGGTTIVSKVQTNATAQVISFNTGAGANNGTAIRGNSSGTPKNLVVLYDNTTGTGRPISIASIEVDGYTQSASYPAFYTGSVEGVAGAWGTIIPNTLPNGIRRIEQRDITTGNFVNCPAVSNNGTWPSGVNTVNPTGGITTVLVIGTTDAPLNSTSFTWLGVNSLWGSSANWACGVPNSSTADVLIPSTTTIMPVLTSDITVRNLTLAGATTLDLLGRTLTVSGVVSGTGTLKGSDNAGLVISGATGTLNFTSGYRKVKSLTLNTGATATLGTTLDITSLDGVVTVNSGATLATGSNLTLKSGPGGTASVGPSAGTISGTATVERFIPNDGHRAWRLLSVPVKGSETFHTGWQENQAPMANGNPGYGTLITGPSGSGMDATTIGYSLLSFNQGNPGSWTGVSNTSTAMQTTGGWMMYIRGDRSAVPTGGTLYNVTPTTLRTKGTLYMGTQPNVTVPASNTNIVVGNIYASAIDFATLTKTGVTGFKVWDPKLGDTAKGAGGYQTFSAATGYDPTPGGGSYGSTPNSRIESGQAFITSSSTGGSITFTESAKTTGSRNVFRSSNSQLIQQFKARLFAITTSPVDTVLADGNSVSFDPAFSNAVDNDDVTKVTNFGENFGILRNNVVLAVEARQPVTSADTVFYKMWNVKTQTYMLQFIPRNLDTTNLTALLVDKYLNTTLPLSVFDTTIVPFIVTADTNSKAQDRFKVILKRSTAMPVTLTSINAVRKDEKVQVDWKVQNEQGVKAYEVEYSTDGRSFKKSGTVNAAGSKEYSWIHDNPAADNYYRVKSIGLSGEEKFTGVVRVTIGKSIKNFNISPNPVTDNRLNLQMNNQPEGTYSLRIINQSGQSVYTTSFQHNGGNSTRPINLSSEVAAGVYQVEVVLQGGTERNTETIIINK